METFWCWPRYFRVQCLLHKILVNGLSDPVMKSNLANISIILSLSLRWLWYRASRILSLICLIGGFGPITLFRHLLAREETPVLYKHWLTETFPGSRKMTSSNFNHQVPKMHSASSYFTSSQFNCNYLMENIKQYCLWNWLSAKR